MAHVTDVQESSLCVLQVTSMTTRHTSPKGGPLTWKFLRLPETNSSAPLAVSRFLGHLQLLPITVTYTYTHTQRKRSYWCSLLL